MILDLKLLKKRIKKIKDYSWDEDLIQQEDYDAKKKELLGL